MTLQNFRIIFLALPGALLSGCVGYDRVLLMTKTNVGLDVDTKPPTAEITIARRELAIQPIFSNYEGKKEGEGRKEEESGLPLLAAFGLTGSFFNPNITAHFAGGDAAVHLVTEEDNTSINSGLCLLEDPSEDPRNFLLKFWHWITFKSYEEAKKEAKEEVRKAPRPFYFATDTSYGVKVAWSGTTGPYPDSLKLGYNRKEFASPPVFVEGEGSCITVKDKRGFEVKLPSFYASIDNAGGYTTLTESGVKHVQFFATGEAATRFAKNPYVKKVVFSHMAPDAAKLKANTIGLNKDLIDEIEEKYEKTTDANEEAKIMQEAIRLELVPDDTKNTEFLGKLRTQSSSPFPEVSRKLNLLRRLAVASPEKSAVPLKSPTQ